MSMPETLETALEEFEKTALNFALRLTVTAEVRRSYVADIAEMSESIRNAVACGELSAGRGAELANSLRNQILEMWRARDLDLGRAYARTLKQNGITFEEALAKAARKLKLDTKAMHELTGAEQRALFEEVIEASGRSRPEVTKAIPRLRNAARVLWLAGIAIAIYNIGTATNKTWQAGREVAGIGGGILGSIGGGAAAGAVGGVWAGPVGVGIGILVGGFLGAVLTDRAYVEAVGTSDALTRGYLSRFTSMWTGVDEPALAQALATELRRNLAFVARVFASLDADYSTDADDVARLYLVYVRRDLRFTEEVRAHAVLRATLVRILVGGWTSDEDEAAIRFLGGR